MMDQGTSAVMQEIDAIDASKGTKANEFGPKISGPLPGPKARAIVERDDR